MQSSTPVSTLNKNTAAAIGLSITSTILSLIAFTFFLVGVIGYSSNNTTVENVNWFYQNGTAGSTGYVGLERIVFDLPGDTVLVSQYSKCNSNLCNVCEIEGNNALGLLIISVIFSFFCIILSALASVTPTVGISGGNAASAFIASLFGVIGWSLFVNKCFNRISQDTTGDWVYGPGSVLSLIAFILMFLVFVFQVAAAALPTATSTGASASTLAART
jgi:hypothetical protein